MGGTLGVALYVGLSVAVSLYIVGFAESFLGVWGFDQSVTNVRVLGTVVLVAVTTLTFISTTLALRRNCFFVSATREPHVHVTSGPVGHRYEVTVFTMDRTFVPEIEAAVRPRLEDVAGVDRSGTG